MVRWAGHQQQQQRLDNLIGTLLVVLVLLIDFDPIWCKQEFRSNAERRQYSIDNYYHSLGKRSASNNIYDSLNVDAPEYQSNLAAPNYLLADSTDSKLDLSKPLDRNLSILLDANGPDMRPSRDYNDFKNISIDLSIRAWQLLREHARAAILTNVRVSGPIIRKILHEAKASDKCADAIKATLDGAMRIESWAVKLINSWGSFPMSGIFEGTYGDVGSFHTCTSIKDNAHIDHAHYCSLTFRPVMPSQRDYELVVRKLPQGLRNFNFNQLDFKQGSSSSSSAQPAGERDAFSALLEHAQYHHYVYYKLGTCWPIQCNPFDVKRIAKLIARKNILLNGPVKCYSLNRTDYDEQYDETGALIGQSPPTVDSAINRTLVTASGAENNVASTLNETTKLTSSSSKIRKLIVSIWDKNGGIFVWKPHFNRPHQIALAIILVVTIFILTMTTIDLFCNKIPALIRLIVLSMKGLQLNYNQNNNQNPYNRQQQQLRTTMLTLSEGGGATSVTKASFALCNAGGMTPAAVRKHPRRPGFSMVPSDAVGAYDQIQLQQRHQQQQEFNQASGCHDGDLSDGEPATAVVQECSFFMGLVDDCSIFTNVPQFFRVSEGQIKNDILCLNGVRCITMVWIIMTHTMMYNDWSAFGRTREVEVALNSLLSQPLFNGSYLVDSFFLMSGLLSAFTAFKHCKGLRAKFNSFAYIFGRWLRLTPQILFVSLLYIVLPAISHGPHWFPIVGEFSENCVNNWWINVLHAQAFYKKDEMCNFVTWWISIDFFYHLFALIVIWIVLLAGHRYGFLSMAVIVLGQVVWQTKRHYELALPPNVLSTIPQAGAMWTTMTLDFYWTPYTHSVPFFFGFYLGYLMALKKKVIVKHLNTRRALIGWFLSITLLFGQSYGTYWWVTGKAEWSRWFSTFYYGACSFIWASSLCWIIIACQHGYGGFVNRLLSCKAFIVLGKASYLVYLSHFQILFLFYGNQYLMIEPTPITMFYIVIGNIFLSTLYGIFLCSVYELPWLKMHRRLMKYV